MRQAPGFSEKTDTHHTCTDREDAEGDEETPCIVATAFGSSVTAPVVAWSAVRRSAAFHVRRGLLARARDTPRRGVIGDAARDVRWLGSLMPSPPSATTPRRPRGLGGRVLIHA